MALFDRSALNPGVPPREVGAWAMYDFANSGYTTVVLTAVFNAYFVGVVAQGADWATLAWTVALALSNIMVTLTMPAAARCRRRHADDAKDAGGSNLTMRAAATNGTSGTTNLRRMPTTKSQRNADGATPTT